MTKRNLSDWASVAEIISALAVVASLLYVGFEIPHIPFQDVGGGIQVGSVLDPFGNAIGLIFNPRFELDD